MAFPSTPLPLRHELLIDGVWTDYTSRTRGADQVKISRGYSGEQASLGAGTCTFKLGNLDGLFSNSNPTSPLFGKIGKNTQHRLSMVESTRFMRMINAATGTTYDGARAQTTDKAVLDVTGDIDVRFDGEADRWSGVPGAILASKYLSTGDQRSWMLFTDTSGYLWFTWTTAGTIATKRAAKSTVRISSFGRQALRATLDVDNGAAGATVTFYTSDTINGTWTQLGAAVIGAGTTSVFSGTANLEVGTANVGQSWYLSFTIDNGFDADVDPFVGKIYGFELRNGIAGTLVADFDPTSRSRGDTSWSDGLGTPNTWTLFASAEISDSDYRFWGELGDSVKGWDGTGTDAWVDVSSSDLISRMQDGNKALDSAIFINLNSATRDGYWPMEQGAGQPGTTPTTISATYGQTGRLVNGTFTTADDFPGTAGALSFDSDDGYASGYASPNGANTGTTYNLWYFKLPSVPVADRVIMRSIFTGGNIYRVDINCGAAGFRMDAYNSDGVLLGTGGALFGTGVSPDRWLAMRILFTQSGGTANWEVAWYPLGAPVVYLMSGSFSGTIGRPRQWQSIGFTGKAGMELAHVLLNRSDAGFTVTTFTNSTNAYIGERVEVRWRRLGEQLNFPLFYRGFKRSGSDGRYRTITMGPQLPKRPIDLFQECAEADGGLLFAPRDKFGLELRPMNALTNQDALDLDYSAKVFAGQLRADPSAFRVRNDVTATALDGTFARYRKTEGPNNVNEPSDDPRGAGQYDVQVTRNVETEEQLEAHAQWEVTLGTWEEDRYPRVQIDLHRAPLVASPTLQSSVRHLDLGAAFDIVNMVKAWVAPGDVHLYVRGYTEIIQNFNQTVVFNAAPYGPYRAGTYDGTVQRIDSASTTLSEDLTTTEQDVSVVTSDVNDIWSTYGTPYDWLIAGERMTVFRMSIVGSIIPVDGSFESGTTTGWAPQDGTFTASATTPYHGTYSGLFTVVGAPVQAYVRPNVTTPCVAGRQYRLVGALYSATATTIFMSVDWSTAGFAYISTTAQSFSIPAGVWTPVSFTTTAPALAANCGYGPTLTGSPVAGTQFRVDDLDFADLSLTGNPQNATVTRSVNGVVKAQVTGADVHVFEPARWALGEGGDVVAAGDTFYASDINQILGKPIVKLVAQASQNLADNTAVALTFGVGSEEIDTHGFHDEAVNPTRITPSVAGYYRIRGAVFLPNRSDYATTYCAIYKNGVAIAPISRPGVSTSGGVRSAEGEGLTSANGSSDYFEVIAFQDNAANVVAATNVSGGFSPYFEVVWERPL